MEYYRGNLAEDLLAIKDEALAPELDRIGKQIGYGRAQQILQILWARHLEESNYPTIGALCPKPLKISTRDKVKNLSDADHLRILKKVLGDTYEEELGLEERFRMWSHFADQKPISEGNSLHCYHKEYEFGGERYVAYFEFSSSLKTPSSMTKKKTRHWSTKEENSDK